MRATFILLFLLLAGSSPARAAQSTALCLGERVQEAVYLGRHLTRSGQLIGVIAKTAEGRFLVLGDYVANRHEQLVSALVRAHGPVTQKYWYGELTIGPELRFTAINETSGSWARSGPNRELVPAQRARELIGRFRPELLDPAVRVTAYDRANEHLDPKLSRLAEYVRHDLQNDVTIISGFLELFAEVHATRWQNPAEFIRFVEQYRSSYLQDIQARIPKVMDARALLAKGGYLTTEGRLNMLLARFRDARDWQDVAQFQTSEIEQLGRLFFELGLVQRNGLNQIFVIPLKDGAGPR